MSSSEEITSQLKKLGITFSGNVIEDINKHNKFYVFIYLRIDSRGRQKPSRKKLKSVFNHFHEKGIEVIFIPMSKYMEHIRNSLCLFAQYNYPRIIKNVFAVFDGEYVDVWIEPNKPIDENTKLEIENKMKEFMRFLNIRLRSLSMTLTGRIASQTAVLKLIRISAPIQHNEIEKILISKGFDTPDNEWLSRMLDRLRKSNKIVRRRDGYFCLSLKALKILGTDKGRNSPDITRALDIARRGG